MKSRSPLLFAAAAALALLAGCQSAAPARPPVNDAPAAADSTAAPVFSAGTWLAKSKDGETYYFALNFNGEPKRVALPDGLFYDYVSEREVSGVLELAAYGTAVLTPRRADPA